MVSSASLVRQVYFPRETLLIAPIARTFIAFGLQYGVLFVFLFLYGIPLRWGLVLAPLLLIPTLLLAYALNLILTPLNALSHDVGRIMGVLLGFAVYLVPVVYDSSRIPDPFKGVYLLNPLAPTIETFRALTIGSAMCDAKWMGIALVVTLILLLIGQMVFAALDQVIADVV